MLINSFESYTEQETENLQWVVHNNKVHVTEQMCQPTHNSDL
jgi:hypothetical protein